MKYYRLSYGRRCPKAATAVVRPEPVSCRGHSIFENEFIRKHPFTSSAPAQRAVTRFASTAADGDPNSSRREFALADRTNGTAPVRGMRSR